MDAFVTHTAVSVGQMEGGGRNNPKFWGPPPMDALWDPSGRPIGLGGAVSWGGVYA